MTHDPRYDAVGSSSLREELYNTYVKTLNQASGKGASDNAAPDDSTATKEDRKARQERAERERALKVQQDRAKVEANIGRSKMGMGREESERDFMCAI